MKQKSSLSVKKSAQRRRRSILKAGNKAGDHFERNVLGRWRNFRAAARFVAGWLVLLLLLVIGVFAQNRQLNTYYLADSPVDGGTFREGILGEIGNVNPIFATSSADRAASRLLFNSLFRYNEEGKIIADLADSISVNKDKTIYTVELKRGVMWHDGESFNADDVVFTYEAIQHPDTRSFLNISWRDVKVQATDEYVVTFTLPNPFAPFIHSLAQGGILPEHILGSVDPGQLRGSEFNTINPVGTGPFSFSALLVDSIETSIGQSQLRLNGFEGYFEGAPRVDHFILITFSDRETMVDTFLAGELSAVGGVQTVDATSIEDSAAELVWYDLPLNNVVFTFYKNSSSNLKDEKVRKALTMAIDKTEIQAITKGRYALIESPILPSQIGYSDELTQPKYNRKRAAKLLNEAGWKYKPGSANDGFRYKKDKKFRIDFITQNSDDYPEVAKNIVAQWRKVGVEAVSKAVDSDLIQQNYLTTHNYDVLLFGLTLGADPDSFVYWHSSQSGVNGFNLAELENLTIDEALESGRTRTKTDLREVKYQAFLKEWLKESPATALYRPAYGYIQRRNVNGFRNMILNTPEDRYVNITRWQVNSTQSVKDY